MTQATNGDAFQAIKGVARGRCGEIIAALTRLPASVVTQHGDDHPCPVCGGATVIWCDKRRGSGEEVGSVACRNCTDNMPTGDIVATVAAFNGTGQAEAARSIADYLGMTNRERFGMRPYVDIIEEVCKAKKMPRKSFERFGVRKDTHGRNDHPVARVSLYNEKEVVHSYFDLGLADEKLQKGKNKPGQANAGLFLPGKLPSPGETWCLVEGVKDASALVGIGYNACGLPKNEMNAKYAPLFRGVNIVIVPNLDNAGIEGAKRTGGRLCGIAATVRVARIPGEVVTSKGDDVRDALQKHGQDAVQDAIENAVLWATEEGGSMLGLSDTLNQIVNLVLTQDRGQPLGALAEGDHLHSPVTRDRDGVEEA